MAKRLGFAVLAFYFVLSMGLAVQSQGRAFPSVLSIRDRAALVLSTTQKRLDQLIPKFMRETGFDMWIIT